MSGISSTFIANFDSFYAAAEKATFSLQKIEVDAEKVQSAVNRMGNSFSGERIAQQAAITAQAIEQIGGAALLTDKEARRVNATMVEAIDKAKRMGMEVPAEYRKLASETERAANAGKSHGGVMQSMTSIAKTAATAFGSMFAVQQLIQFGKQIVAMGGDLTDMAAKTGVSTTAIQQFKYAGGQMGVEVESITKGINKMQKSLDSDDKSAVGALQKLGISVGDFKKLKPEEQFSLVAEKLGGVENAMTKAGLAQDIFGGASLKLMPALSKEFGELTAKANSLGIVMDEETVAAMDTLGDTVSDLSSVALASLGKVIAPLVPLLSGVAQIAVKLASVLGDVLKVVVEAVGARIKRFAYDVLELAASVVEGMSTMAAYIPGLNAMVNASGALGVASEKLRKMQTDLYTETAKTAKVTAVASDEFEEGAKKTNKQKDAVAGLIDEISGKNLADKINDYAKAIQKMGGVSNISAAEQLKLGKQFSEMAAQGGKLPPVLQQLATSYELTQIKALPVVSTSQSVQTLFKAFPGVMAPFSKSLDQVSTSFGLLKAQTLPFTTSLPEAVNGFFDGLKPRLDDTRSAFSKLASTIGGGLTKSLSALPSTIMGALQGGGDVVKSVGSLFGSNLGTSLVTDFGGKITKLFGKTLGEGLNAVIPGLGAMLGPLLGALTSKIKSFFGGVSEETKKVRQEIDAFETTLAKNLTTTQAAEAAGRGWAQTTIAVRDAYLATGRTAAEAEAIVRQLWDDKHPNNARAAMEKINAVIAEAKERFEKLNTELTGTFQEAISFGVALPDSMQGALQQLADMGKLTGENADLLKLLTGDGANQFKAMEEAAKKYGVELSALGPAFAQNKINEEATGIIDAFNTMTKNGADVGGVIAGMSDEINDFIQNAIKSGSVVPENMRPILETMIEQGKLTDANGDKLTDLSGIKFGPPVESAFDRIIKKLQELIDKLSGNMGFDTATENARTFSRKATEAIDGIPRNVSIRFNGEYSSGGGSDTDTGYASGTKGRHGSWFKNFGAGTVTMLHGTEAVVRKDQAAAFAEANGGGGNADLLYELQGLREFMASLPQHMARAVRDAVLVAG